MIPVKSLLLFGVFVEQLLAQAPTCYYPEYVLLSFISGSCTVALRPSWANLVFDNVPGEVWSNILKALKATHGISQGW